MRAVADALRWQNSNRDKIMKLKDFFMENPKAAIAFSGGVDSAYLLYAAIQCGAKVKAYYVKSDFQPDFELEDALRLAKDLQAEMEVIRINILADPVIAANPANRCYYCKKTIFSEIKKAAEEDGFPLLLDGTNASDDAGDRPGMRALKELEIRSPLRECALTKQEIRELSKKAGLFTWKKPAYACLATRIPQGMEITEKKLRMTEQAEKYLAGLGLADFRVRLLGDMARLQVSAAWFDLVMAHRKEIVTELKKSYSAVFLDLEERG